MMRTALLIAVVALLGGCQSRKNTSALPAWLNSAGDGMVILTYEKTPCFGACPSFTFTWYAAGNVAWEGKHFVERMGTHSGKLDRDKFARVLEVANRIGYYDLDDTYDNKLVTDLPATTTEIHTGEGLKRVTNRYQGPEALNELYQVLDALLQEVTWSEAPSNAQ